VGEDDATRPDAAADAASGADDYPRPVSSAGTDDLEAEASAQQPPTPRRDPVRSVVRGTGEVLITLGVLLLLMCVYQLWWTNLESAQAITASRDEIVAGWRQTPAPTPSKTGTASAAPVAQPAPAYGTGFALLYIPRLKDKVWGLPIHQGVGKDVLAQGAGHYRTTAMPGEIGNFAIAAHRSTHDEPFANFPDLQAGDKVYVQTRTEWFVYTLTKDDPNLSPTDVWVILPVPGKPGASPTQRLLTMTTCTPRYGSTGRWAWWGTLTATSPTTSAPPDGLTGTA
jgi:sortase A